MKRAVRWGSPAVLVAAGRVGADTWTNAAGDTLEAEAECDGRTVLFRRPGGEEVRLLAVQSRGE